MLNNSNTVMQQDIDLVSDSLYDIMKDIAKQCDCFPKVSNTRHKRTCKKQPWFNRECEDKRGIFMRALNADKKK